jgi:hypothetical protein
VTYLALGDLLDVAAKTGKPKVTKVKNIKHSDPYSPVVDFYKPLREGIAAIHRAGKTKTALQGLLSVVTDKKKKTNYPGAVAGYSIWWGTSTFTWFDPPKSKYAKQGFEVGVNPELGLEWNGVSHVIKLYMNVEELLPPRAALIGALMTHVLGSFAPSGTVMGVLDMRRSKLIPAAGNTQALMATVDSVIADIASIWPAV